MLYKSPLYDIPTGKIRGIQLLQSRPSVLKKRSREAESLKKSVTETETEIAKIIEQDRTGSIAG